MKLSAGSVVTSATVAVCALGERHSLSRGGTGCPSCPELQSILATSSQTAFCTAAANYASCSETPSTICGSANPCIDALAKYSKMCMAVKSTMTLSQIYSDFEC
uniref:Uncharacterized protein n=1 Tax=Mucochytrium quahogii TaxID=96639 RepID=A0A7S2RVQ7_9STRA